VLHHPLVVSAVTGATNLRQLSEIFSAAEQPSLSEEVLMRIDEIHAISPSPTP
jgi:aryl-alcohol dehydrogenase-like predicted oxidoreductase